MRNSIHQRPRFFFIAPRFAFFILQHTQNNLAIALNPAWWRAGTLNKLFVGAAEAVSGLCNGTAGPHSELIRAGGPAQLRPGRPRLPARRADASQQAQARHQVQTKTRECSLSGRRL